MGEASFMPYAEAFGQEKAEALKAIQLGDSHPEPYLDLGFAAMDLNWDWAALGKNLRRGLELNPNSDAVHWAYASYLTRIGQPEKAIAEAKLATQLDPVSSRSYTNTSFTYYFARKYDEALHQMQQGAALDADRREILFPLGTIYVEMGLYDEAFHDFLKLGDAPHALGHLGNAYARAGRTAEARAILPKLKDHIDKTGIGRYEIALVYAGLKENDNAFDWLEKAYQARDKGLTYLKIDPCMDPLRSDPRFQSLVARVGFPAEP
jgi:tetratricopeptide (TPR) repeat protein